MAAGALVVIVAAVLAVAAVCALITAAIFATCGVPRSIGFGWGATLGPVGVLIALIAQERHRRRTSTTAIVPCE